MTTRESNKLLAEFIGQKDLDKNINIFKVLGKIDEIIGIDLHEWDNYINDALCSKSENKIFEACVEFVKWYNNQNK